MVGLRAYCVFCTALVPFLLMVIYRARLLAYRCTLRAGMLELGMLALLDYHTGKLARAHYCKRSNCIDALLAPVASIVQYIVKFLNPSALHNAKYHHRH